MIEEQERYTLKNITREELKCSGIGAVCSICNKSLTDKIVVPLDITKSVSISGDNAVHQSCKYNKHVFISSSE